MIGNMGKALRSLGLLASWAGATLALLGGEAHALTASEMNAALGQGINMGNYLDCPTEGAWHQSQTILQSDFTKIKAQGYTSVRIPVRWSEHPAGSTAPYTIDPVFMNRVKDVVGWAIAADLKVVLNVHHYTKTYDGSDGDADWDTPPYESAYKEDPAAHRARLHAIWTQISTNFKSISADKIVFEMLNEPEVETAAPWNAEVAAWITLMRTTLGVTQHTLMVNAKGWNSVADLSTLEIPQAETNLIASFHYYGPMDFTHQGATWQVGAPPAYSVNWTGTVAQMTTLTDAFDQAADWAAQANLPVNVGEFGAIKTAPALDRKIWTQAVVSVAKSHGFSTHYWEYSEGFGVYDIGTDTWNVGLVAATQGNYVQNTNKQLLWNPPNPDPLNTGWFAYNGGSSTINPVATNTDTYPTNVRDLGYFHGSATLSAAGSYAGFGVAPIQSAYNTPVDLKTSDYPGVCVTYRADNAVRLVMNDSVQAQALKYDHYGAELPATNGKWVVKYFDWEELARENASTDPFVFDLSKVNSIQFKVSSGNFPYTVNLDVGQVGFGQSCSVTDVGWKGTWAGTVVWKGNWLDGFSALQSHFGGYIYAATNIANTDYFTNTTELEDNYNAFQELKFSAVKANSSDYYSLGINWKSVSSQLNNSTDYENEAIVDISAHSGVCLTYRAPKAFRLNLIQGIQPNDDAYGAELPAVSDFTTSFIPFTSMTQHGFAGAYDMDLERQKGIEFEILGSGAASGNTIEIVEIGVKTSSWDCEANYNDNYTKGAGGTIAGATTTIWNAKTSGSTASMYTGGKGDATYSSTTDLDDNFTNSQAMQFSAMHTSDGSYAFAGYDLGTGGFDVNTAHQGLCVTYRAPKAFAAQLIPEGRASDQSWEMELQPSADYQTVYMPFTDFALFGIDYQPAFALDLRRLESVQFLDRGDAGTSNTIEIVDVAWDDQGACPVTASVPAVGTVIASNTNLWNANKATAQLTTGGWFGSWTNGTATMSPDGTPGNSVSDLYTSVKSIKSTLTNMDADDFSAITIEFTTPATPRDLSAVEGLCLAYKTSSTEDLMLTLEQAGMPGENSYRVAVPGHTGDYLREFVDFDELAQGSWAAQFVLDLQRVKHVNLMWEGNGANTIEIAELGTSSQANCTGKFNYAPVVAGTLVPVTALEDFATPVTRDLSALFTDRNNDALTVTVSTGTKVVASIDPTTKVLTLSKLTHVFGTEDLTILATDGNGGSISYLLSVSITAVNDAPIATASAALLDRSRNEDFTTFDVPVDAATLFDDVDDNDATLTLSATSSNTALATVLISNGNMQVTSVANKAGTATICVVAADGGENGAGTASQCFLLTVHPVNEKPVITYSGASTLLGTENEEFSGTKGYSVLLSEISVTDEEDMLTSANYTVGTDGNIACTGAVNAGNYNFSCTSVANKSGTAEIYVIVTDLGQGTAAALKDTLTFTVELTNLPDAPVAVNDNYSVDEDGTLAKIAADGVLMNDTDADGDALTATLVTDVAHGTLSLNTNGSFTYAPVANYNGPDVFTYKAKDPGGLLSEEKTVHIDVISVNDAPAASATAFTVAAINEEGTATVVPTSFFTDVEDDAASKVLTYELTASNNKVSVSGMVVTGALNVFGTVTLSLKATDSDGASFTRTAELTINSVNDASVTMDDAYTVAEDGTLAKGAAEGVLNNDTDVDGDVLTVTLATGVAHGALTLNSDGSFSYVPTANYSGADEFTYVVNDGTVNSGTVKVSLTITSVNDLPVLAAGVTLPDLSLASNFTSQVIDLSVLAPSDVDGGTIAYSVNSQTLLNAVVSGTNLTLSSIEGKYGEAEITVTVADGQGGSVTKSFKATIAQPETRVAHSGIVTRMNWQQVIGATDGQAQLVNLSGRTIASIALPATVNEVQDLVRAHGDRAILRIGKNSWNIEAH